MRVSSIVIILPTAITQLDLYMCFLLLFINLLENYKFYFLYLGFLLAETSVNCKTDETVAECSKNIACIVFFVRQFISKQARQRFLSQVATQPVVNCPTRKVSKIKQQRMSLALHALGDRNFKAFLHAY